MIVEKSEEAILNHEVVALFCHAFGIIDLLPSELL
jgi:hypothetical protein